MSAIAAAATRRRSGGAGGCRRDGGAGVVLTVFAWDDLVTGDAINNLCALPAGVLYAMLGALIVRRAGNVIGWYLPGEGIPTAILGLASAYAVLGVRNPGTLPQSRFVGLLAEWSFASLVCGLAFMFLVFPAAHLPSPRWRPGAGPGSPRHPDLAGQPRQRPRGGERAGLDRALRGA
jgi:hypothetical protein